METFVHPTRLSQVANTRRYDQVARIYSWLEPLYLIFPPARVRAVVALGLEPGDVVLEVGAGTGRNFRYLVEAVGPTGKVIGVDPSPGMIAEARRLVEREGWTNVEPVERFTASRPLRLLDPIARLLVKLGHFLFDYFYVSVVQKA